jgi:hypothetical protein
MNEVDSSAPHSRPVAGPSAKSGLATASLVLGILAIPTCWLTGIPAIITGHMGLSQIKKSGGVMQGGGKALAGLLIGYLSLIFVIPALAGLTVPLVIRQLDVAEQANSITRLRMLGAALNEYHVAHGTEAEPFPNHLKQLDERSLTRNVEDLLAVRARSSGDWLYFPLADPENPAAPLLISPIMGQKRIALTVDQAVRLMSAKPVNDLIKSSPTPAVEIPAPVKP